jgi:hypothetical protein
MHERRDDAPNTSKGVHHDCGIYVNELNLLSAYMHPLLQNRCDRQDPKARQREAFRSTMVQPALA